MTISTRFGKRLELPSTISIKHELRLMAATEAVCAAGLLEPGARETLVGNIAASNGLSPDRVRMLVNRFALAQAPVPTQPAVAP